MTRLIVGLVLIALALTLPATAQACAFPIRR